MSPGRTGVLGAAVLVGCMLLLAQAAAAATFSDGFAGRETVSGVPVEVSGSNVGATAEAGDQQAKPFSPGPSFHPAGHSVWVEWEAAQTGYVTVSLCGSGVPVVLGIYRGFEPVELGHLSELRAGQVGRAAGCNPIEAGFTFRAEAGGKYELFVDGDADPFQSGPTEGPLALRIEATPRPSNDDFAGAALLSGRWESENARDATYRAAADGYTWAATAEPGEPRHGAEAAGASVWYRWTAPESGNAEINLGDRPGIRFAAYRGTSLGGLERVLAGPELGTLPVVSGTEYRIAVDAAESELGPRMSTFRISIGMYKALAPAPAPAATQPPQARASRAAISLRRLRSPGRSATFRFGAEGAAGFLCALDRGGPKACRSPKTYLHLAPGRHVLRVSAVDAAGKVDAPPAVARFAVVAPKARHGHSAGH